MINQPDAQCAARPHAQYRPSIVIIVCETVDVYAAQRERLGRRHERNLLALVVRSDIADGRCLRGAWHMEGGCETDERNC